MVADYPPVIQPHPELDYTAVYPGGKKQHKDNKPVVPTTAATGDQSEEILFYSLGVEFEFVHIAPGGKLLRINAKFRNQPVCFSALHYEQQSIRTWANGIPARSI